MSYPTMQRIYDAPRRGTAERRFALWCAWRNAAFEARLLVEEAATSGDHGSASVMRNVARRLASGARDVVATFGVRVDGKKRRPFPHQLPPKNQAAA